MYGTVARLRAKPGVEEKLTAMAEAEDMRAVPGFVRTICYRMDADMNEYYMVVLFESKEAYVKNAESPDQDARYREWVALLEGEPEWHDGEIVFMTP